MMIGKADAKRLMSKVRDMKADLKQLLAGSEPCDRCKAILVLSDVAELLIADETTHEHHEPKDVVFLKKLIKMLELYIEELTERVTAREETNGLF